MKVKYKNNIEHERTNEGLSFPLTKLVLRISNIPTSHN